MNDPKRLGPPEGDNGPPRPEARPPETAGRNGRTNGLRAARSAQERLQELEAELRQAQRLAALGQLAAGIAHDFNNILTVIQGHAGLLLAAPAVRPEMRQSLQDIGAAARRAASLTRQLLTFSRKQTAERVVLDLNDLIQRVNSMLCRLIGENIRLQCELIDPAPWVRADPACLEQVLLNLALNARDAMPEGGVLTVRTEPVCVNEAHAQRNPDARPGGFVCLSVEDNGCGMSAEVLERVFDPFFTTKAADKGTGLGLSIVVGIVKQHAGWIEAASQVGEGSCFRVFLPRANQAPVTQAAQPLPLRLGVTPATILVVEDDKVVLTLTAHSLRHFGYRVLAAADGIEALRLWQQHHGHIDLLLTDIVMPEGISGKLLAQTLQSQSPHLKVIYTSGYWAELRSETNSPSCYFLPKPFDPPMLIQTVRAALDGTPPEPFRAPLPTAVGT